MVALGLMAMEFRRGSYEDVLDAVAALGATAVQFDLGCAGGASLPAVIDEALAARVRSVFAARGLQLAAVSAYFNMIGPDPAERQAGLDGLRRLLPHCAAMGTSVVAMGTGSRHTNMWRRHPDNDTPEAWRDLVAIMGDAVRAAEKEGVTLAIEPEVNNVVDSARKARRLIDEIGSPRLKIVMDGANIFHAGELARMHEVLDETFTLVGGDIALAHAKDLDHDGDAGHLPAGKGLLDFSYYLKLLQGTGYDGAIILHGLKEAEAADSLAFVRRSLAPAA